MIYFEKGHVRKLDIVVNNKNGVENSRFMYGYSVDIQIRSLLILAKAWARESELIDMKKFSSHGICYMMLYYLMKKGVIPWISGDEEKFKTASKKKK